MDNSDPYVTVELAAHTSDGRIQEVDIDAVETERSDWKLSGSVVQIENSTELAFGNVEEKQEVSAAILTTTQGSRHTIPLGETVVLTPPSENLLGESSVSFKPGDLTLGFRAE